YVEEEECEEDVDEDEKVFETNNEPIFYMYPLEEEEFVSGDEEVVLIDDPVFYAYPLEEEFVFGDEEVVRADRPIFYTFSLEEEFVTGNVREVDHEEKIVFAKIYEQIEKVEVHEEATHEYSSPVEGSIILITRTGYSIQVEETINKK